MIAWALAVAVVLYALPLEDLPPERPRPSVETGAPSPPLPAAAPARRIEASRFKGGGVGRFDRAAFLSAFERQAKAELLPCLRASRGPSGTATLLARLHRSGRLTAIRAIDGTSVSGVSSAECVREAVARMSFDPRSIRLDQESVETEWRVDW